jgi:hypothetical protein
MQNQYKIAKEQVQDDREIEQLLAINVKLYKCKMTEIKDRILIGHNEENIPMSMLASWSKLTY